MKIDFPTYTSDSAETTAISPDGTTTDRDSREFLS
jgi:hypothetical protein